MAKKLTLSLNEQTIIKAKIWAKAHHASLSGLVECYFESLIAQTDDTPFIASKTRSLSGLFKAHDEGLSYKELMRKHKSE